MTTPEATTTETTTTETTTTETTATATAAVARFSAAFDAQDIDAIMAAMTPGCVFEDTSPPDGTRHTGADAVRAAWTALFTASPDGAFTAEETIAAGDRVVVRWRYDWGEGHIRGIDMFAIRDGLVAEKLAYVKG
jgi:ketosteroid isomerase-like protein